MNPLSALVDMVPAHPRLGDYLALPPDHADAVLTENERWDYARLRDAVAKAAAGLIARGIAPGDRVATLAQPGPDFWVSFLAAARVGAIWLGLSPRSTSAELAVLIEDAAPRLILTGEGCDATELPTSRPVIAVPIA